MLGSQQEDTHPHTVHLLGQIKTQAQICQPQGQLRTWQPLPVYHLIFLSLDVAIINLAAYSG